MSNNTPSAYRCPVRISYNHIDSLSRSSLVSDTGVGEEEEVIREEKRLYEKRRGYTRREEVIRQEKRLYEERRGYTRREEAIREEKRLQ